MTFTKQVSIDPPSDTFEICNFHFVILIFGFIGVTKFNFIMKM